MCDQATKPNSPAKSELENSWTVGTLSDVIADVRGGFSVNCDDRPAGPGEIGVLKTGSVLNYQFRPEENKAVLTNELGRIRTPVSAGKIIICRKNSEEVVGASALVSEDHPNLFLSDLLWQITPAAGVSLYWLYSTIASDRVRSLIRIAATGTQASMKNISQDRLLAIPVRIPPLAEQRKIASILRTWDEGIANLSALKSQREKAFRWFQHRLIDRDFNAYDDILEQYATIPSLEKITSLGGVQPLTVKLHCKGVVANGRDMPVTLSDTGRPYYRRQSGDFLIGRQNFHNGGFGIVPSELEGFIASNAITSLRIDESKLDTKFLFYFFSRKEYYLRIGQIMDGTGQKELSDKQIKKLPVSIPSLARQKEIVQILNSAVEEISLISDNIDALTKQRRGLTQKLLTGDWRVKPEEVVYG
jgi:type I restriction enzyme S subunit